MADIVLKNRAGRINTYHNINSLTVHTTEDTDQSYFKTQINSFGNAYGNALGAIFPQMIFDDIDGKPPAYPTNAGMKSSAKNSYLKIFGIPKTATIISLSPFFDYQNTFSTTSTPLERLASNYLYIGNILDNPQSYISWERIDNEEDIDKDDIQITLKNKSCPLLENMLSHSYQSGVIGVIAWGICTYYI